MKKKILTENSRTTQVEATTKSGEYEYQVSYSYDGKELRRLSCNINKVTGLEGSEERAYSGHMSSENGNKSMNFPEDVEIAPHVTMFESILQEVNEGMAAL